MSEFTPGPWEVFAPRICAWPGVDAPSASIIIFADIDEDRGVQGETYEEALANARLIASAPTMYAALQKIDKFWTTDFPDGPVKESRAAKGSLTELLTGSLSDDTIEVWRLIRAALAAADGKDAEPKP